MASTLSSRPIAEGFVIRGNPKKSGTTDEWGVGVLRNQRIEARCDAATLENEEVNDDDR
jgi:hypothetical protein